MKRFAGCILAVVTCLGLLGCGGMTEGSNGGTGSYWSVNACYTEKGMLYFDPHSQEPLAYYFDYGTKEYFPICSKSNCLHNSEDCAAYHLWESTVMIGRLGDKWYRLVMDGNFNTAFYSTDLDGENDRKIGAFFQYPFGAYGKSFFYEDACILSTLEADFNEETGDMLGITSGIYRYHLDSGEAENLCSDITQEEFGDPYVICGMYKDILVYLQSDSQSASQVLKCMDLETKEVSEPLGSAYVQTVNMQDSIMACNIREGDTVRLTEYDMETGELTEIAELSSVAQLFWDPELKIYDITEGSGETFRFQMYQYKDGEGILIREGGEEEHFIPFTISGDLVVGQAGEDGKMAYMETEAFLNGENSWTILEY